MTIRTSDSIAAITPAFIACQAALPSVPKKTKGQVGSAVRFYSDLTTVIDTIKPVLEEHKLGYLQAPTSDNGEIVVTTRILHVSGEWFEESLGMPVERANAQAVGSAISYAKRYALVAMFGLASDDDDGAAASKPAPRQAAPKAEAPSPAPAPTGEKASDAQITKIAILLNERDGKDRDAKLARLTHICGRPIASSKDLTKHEASTVIEELAR